MRCPECETKFRQKYARWTDDGHVICPNPECKEEVEVHGQTPTKQVKVLDELLNKATPPVLHRR